ncbi:wax ester/triacylglycerol synthase domain-containing protein [Actinacidiphila paucisporea]|nr:wax ester/triacylglycerol synthase domain-containing protein [Actinacidiphila paucisporea]
MAQAHPATSQTVGVLLHLEGAPPSLGELRSHVAGHLRDEPRLTHYLHGPGLRARWRHEPAPDLDTRVRALDVPPGDARLDDALHELVERPLPGEGPLWDVWLLSGYATDRYAVCYRAHHSAQDGMGIIGTLHTLFGATTAPPAASAVRTGPRAYLRTVRSTLAACAANGVWDDPARPLSGARTVDWVSVPTGRLRTAAAARGGDTNDAFLAALSGALRTWCSEHWPRGAGRPLPAITMINLRRAEERARPGNLIAFAPLALPCDEPAAGDRLDGVIAQTRATKDPAHQSALRALMDRTPARAFHAMAGRLTTPARVPITVSYLAIHRPLAYRGDPVARVQPFTWLPPRQPASIVACSYNGDTSVCFTTDAALPAGRSLPRLFREAAEELAGGAVGPEPSSPPGGTAVAAPVAVPIDDGAPVAVADFALIKKLLVDHGALPAEPITPDATQPQAGIDSMAVTALSMAIEDRLGLIITEHDLAKAPTVGDMVDLVNRQAALPSGS